MTTQRLSAFERAVVAGLATKASLAAPLLEAWAELPANAPQSARSLIRAAQLGLTEERDTHALLDRAVSLGLAVETASGFVAASSAHASFGRLALSLYSVDHYRSLVHRDATVARVVLTRPPRPSTLEQKLNGLGWRTAELEPTDRAFHSMVLAARQRVVVMTPFFDTAGALWLQELFALTAPGVERCLILRSLDDNARSDYPRGFDAIAPWLQARHVDVFDYSIARTGGGRETFHAKAVLCDRSTAYLGSSNVTAASLGHSMEMGVVLEGHAAHAVANVLDAVLAAARRLVWD